MPISTEERKALISEAFRAYLREASGFSENTRILLEQLFDNVLAPMMFPEPMRFANYPTAVFPGPGAVTVPASTWSKETKHPNGTDPARVRSINCLNVLKLFRDAVEVSVLEDSDHRVTVTVDTEPHLRSRVLQGEQAMDFLKVMTRAAMFDETDELDCVRAVVAQVKAENEKLQEALRRQFGEYGPDSPADGTDEHPFDLAEPA